MNIASNSKGTTEEDDEKCRMMYLLAVIVMKISKQRCNYCLSFLALSIIHWKRFYWDFLIVFSSGMLQKIIMPAAWNP